MYASCSRLACTAPAAAIAALMPQIDTADDSSARSRVVEPEPATEPPGEPEHDADQDERLQDGRPGRGQDHREVDRRPEQHEPGLDEELGAEAARQPVAQAEPSARLPSRPSRIAYTGNSIAAAIPANAVPLAAAGTVCSRKRVSAARATTTATPASAAWIESRGPGRPWLQQGGLAAMGWGAGPPAAIPEPRVSVWSLIRAPASGQQARQHQRQQEQAHDGRGPVFVEGEPAGRRDGRVGGRELGCGDSGRGAGSLAGARSVR